MTNIRQIRRLVPYWLSALNLREWTVTVRWGSPKEMDEAESVGLNYFSVEELESNVLLDKRMDPAMYEETLVHELLHLAFDGHKLPTTKYDPLHERALNRTAKALLELSRAATQTE